MRTTTKRGLGRGSVLHGDRRPVLPPGAPTAVTLYRQPPPPRRSRWAIFRRVLLWTLIVLVMCAGAAGGGAYLWFHESVAAVVATTPEVKIAAKKLDVALPGEPATALVIGSDKRKGDTRSGYRSDTLMLVRADPNTKTISLLSFPRDLAADIVCPGKPTYRAKINEAYGECGARGSLQTVKKLTGTPINYLITVNFRGLREVVEAVGGVWVDVDRRYFNDRSGPDGYATINLLPGYQRLGGWQALDFVRYRHTDSDLYRLARQQLFVRAFKTQVAAVFSATTLPKVVSTITRNVEVGVGGGAELDGLTVLRYALFAYSLPPGHFFQPRIEGLAGYFDLTTAPENIAKAVEEFTQPDLESPRNATTVALGEKPKPTKAPQPRDTTITVLNGNGVAGAASTASHLLAQRGYAMQVPPAGKSADAPSWDYFKTQVALDPKQPGAPAAAKKVAALFGTDDVVTLTPQLEALANGSMLVVVIGRTFHGSLAAAPVDRTPKRQPPDVVPGADAALPYLRERAAKVRFPLLVPTTLARGSRIDSERPVRLYRIDPDRRHKALRLTYRTANGEYWGVQMTDWEDAPVLSERNFYRTIGGRRYQLHYTGSKLHMIVLRQNGATYWVVNTLLDSLSNETMIEIAKGLKRLSK